MTHNHNKKRTKTKILIVSGIGLVILTLLIGGIYYWRKNYQVDRDSLSSQNEVNDYISQSDCSFYDKQKNLITLTGEANFTRGKLLDFTNLSQVPRVFVVKLWNKGYHWTDILQLWDWKIPETDIPNLNAEKRIGVINSLFVMVDFTKESDEEWTGGAKNCVVIVRKIPSDGL